MMGGVMFVGGRRNNDSLSPSVFRLPNKDQTHQMAYVDPRTFMTGTLGMDIGAAPMVTAPAPPPTPAPAAAAEEESLLVGAS